MNDIPGQDGNWSPCPPGVIQEVAASAALARRSFLGWGLIFATVSLFAVAATASYFASQKPQHTQTISCEEARVHFCALAKEEIICCTLQKKICAHIHSCDPCRCNFISRCCEAGKDRPTKATIKPPCGESDTNWSPSPSPSPSP